MNMETYGVGGVEKTPLTTKDVESAINILKEKNDMYGRIAAEAVNIWNKKNIPLETQMKWLTDMQTDRVYNKIKSGWDDATIKGIRDPNDAKQEGEWAEELAEELIFQNLYSQVAEEAIKVLNTRKDIKPDDKAKALVFLQSSKFIASVKARWDEDKDILRGSVDKDKKGKLVKGMVIKLLSEASLGQ